MEGLPEAAPACRPQEGSWAGRIVGRDDWPAQSPVRGSPACAFAWATVLSPDAAARRRDTCANWRSPTRLLPPVTSAQRPPASAPMKRRSATSPARISFWSHRSTKGGANQPMMPPVFLPPAASHRARTVSKSTSAMCPLCCRCRYPYATATPTAPIATPALAGRRAAVACPRAPVARRSGRASGGPGRSRCTFDSSPGAPASVPSTHWPCRLRLNQAEGEGSIPRSAERWTTAS